jgi:hypothetical protein
MLGGMLLAAAPAAAAWDCSSDCWAETRGCGGLSACAKTYASCLAYKAASCAAQASKEGEPMHGNFCGRGKAGGETPIDELDAACMRHDACYDLRGPGDCACDRAFLQAVAELLVSGRLSSDAVEKAALITAYFGAKVRACPPE